MRKLMQVAALAGVMLGAAGCATLPATDIGERTATLHANGLTGDFPMNHWFEYVVDRTTDEPVRTPVRGPVPPHTPLSQTSETITGLAVGWLYRYRACGQAVTPGAPVVCLGWERFQTLRTVEALCGREVFVCLTRPATDLTPTTATLKGEGFKMGRPLEYWFEYQERPAGSTTKRTPTRTLTASQSAPVAPRTEPITGLRPDTAYASRLCAHVLDEPADVECFNWAWFDTPYVAPSYPRRGGTVTATGSARTVGDQVAYTDIAIDAAADASGANPRGSAFLRSPLGGVPFSGKVTCVNVVGKTATVNYLEDHWQAIRTVYLEDNGGAGKDRLGLDSGRYADDCSPAPGPESLTVTLDTGRVAISGG